MLTLIRCLCLLIAAVVLSACAPRQDLTVFAASSLTDAMNELADGFEAANPGVRVVRNYAGSSQLAAQILEGAPADVFASANPAQMQTVAEAGLLADAPVTLTTNRLTVITPTDNPAAIETLTDLAQPGIALILAAPGVPVRAYTDQVVTAAFDDPAVVYANVVSEEDNVRQVVAKIALGEADAGIVYTSDVTPGLDVQPIPIPERFNVTAIYPIAPLTDTDLARRFIAYVLSDEGQAILRERGFGE